MEKQIRSILAILSTDIPGYTEKIEKKTKKAEDHMKISIDIWKDADSEYGKSNKAKEIYKAWK